MESLLERLSSYNILNNLIPGAVFVFLINYFNIVSLPLDGIVENIFIYYFCGIVVSRIGSLVIEGLLKKLKWIEYTSKAEYVAATKKDKLIESLLEVSNMYRTFAGLFLTLGIMKGCSELVRMLQISESATMIVFVLAMFVLFLKSFIKQSEHIKSRIYAANNNAEGK